MTNNPFTVEDGVFVNCPTLFEGRVIVPDGITDIGDKAFLCCNKVTEMILQDTLEGIGMCAFYGCKNLRYIKMPSHVVIEDRAFDGCPEDILIEKYQ